MRKTNQNKLVVVNIPDEIGVNKKSLIWIKRETLQGRKCQDVKREGVQSIGTQNEQSILR